MLSRRLRRVALHELIHALLHLIRRQILLTRRDRPLAAVRVAVRTAWMNAVTKRAQDMGIVIVAGVDSLTIPNDPLPAIHKDLELMVTARS